MLYTIADIEEYFRQLAANHVGIKDVVIGDSEEVLSVDRSRLNYPLLWLETPDVNWNLRSPMRREYSIAFVVLINAQTDNWKLQRYILHQTLEITQSLLARISEDASMGWFKIPANAKSDPILGYGHDHDYGWRTSFSIETPMNACADCQLLSPGAWAFFTWQNNTPGGFTNLIIQDESDLGELTWTTTWRWQIDAGTVQTSSNLPPENLGSGAYIIIWKTMVSGSITRIASAFIVAEERCGASVPYLIEQY